MALNTLPIPTLELEGLKDLRSSDKKPRPCWGALFEDVETSTACGGAFRPHQPYHKPTFGVAVAVSANRAFALAAFAKSASRK